MGSSQGDVAASATRRALDWSEISAIATGLDGNRQKSTAVLSGKVVDLARPDSTTKQLAFDKARIRVDHQTHPYDAVECGPDLFLLGFQHSAESRRASIWVLDFENRAATAADILMPTLAQAQRSLLDRVHAGAALSAATVDFSHWSINGHSSAPPDHRKTQALVGKRLRYVYGDGGVYEHIYLNEQLFTWHCLAGPEKGLADTDACATFAIRPNIQLFCWQEKIIPTVGIVLVNATREPYRSNGFLMGIDTRTGAVSYFPVGAKGLLLNVTEVLP